jgi:transposase
MAKGSAPQIVALNTAQLEELLAKLAELVPVETYRLLESVLRTFQWLVGAMEAKNTTLGRLRRIIFGKQTEKTSAVLAQGATTGSDKTKTKAKGHGRKAAQDYSGALPVKVTHPLHRIGELCPKCLKGKLYRLRVPARLVRIVAQPIFQATRFELERLRCALCGALLTAPPPPEAGLNK